VSVILVVDEHGVYRSGLRALIETRVEQSRVAEASSIEGTQASECFDLILIDADCLTQRSLSVLKQIPEVNPATRFAVMSTSNIRADVLNCLCAGFHGFIHKLQPDSELITAVNDLLSGRIYVPRWFAEGEDNTSELPPSVDIRMKRPRLTPRQREILPLLAQGMSNKEIARHLHIAEGTTKIHTAALLQALGARNRTEAAFLAATLVSSSEPFRLGGNPAPGLPTERRALLGCEAKDKQWLRRVD
jgi:DNA-binding NarL/FixJ family response regulator